MINVLEETVRNNNIVLWSGINETASWMALKSSEEQDCSRRISSTLGSFLVSSSSCHVFLPLVVRQYKKCSWRLSLILQNSIAPPRSRCSLPWRRWINFFDTSSSEIEYSRGSTSVQILSPIRKVLVDELAESCLCGFGLAFDRLVKSPAFNINAYSSNCTSEVSSSLLFKFVTNLFEPWEILTHEWELSLHIDVILISTPYLPCKQQVVASNEVPILVVPLIQPFGSDVSSPLGKMYSRQATASVNCENYAVSFVMKYCLIFQQHSGILHPYKICSICLVVIIFQFVLRISAIEDLCEHGHHYPKARLSWSHWARMTNSTVLPQRVSPFNHERFHILHTFLRLLREDRADLQK